MVLENLGQKDIIVDFKVYSWIVTVMSRFNSDFKNKQARKMAERLQRRSRWAHSRQNHRCHSLSVANTTFHHSSGSPSPLAFVLNLTDCLYFSQDDDAAALGSPGPVPPTLSAI